MRDFNYVNVCESLLTREIVTLLTKIHECRGRQDLFIEAKSDALDHLMEIAKIQSTEASNRIEGIFTSNERLKMLVKNKTRPHNREEQEIIGYRDVLATIHDNYDYIPPKSNMFLQLHRDLFKYSGKSVGGAYKSTNNVIQEEDAAGNNYIRFEPVAAWETPDAIEKICESFDKAVSEQAEMLIVIPAFILDFLCIHPFLDGNGRMSRLLTLLLLYRAGFIVGKYISIEYLIEQSKETYYEALYNSSQNWHEGTNDYSAFVEYILRIILAAYRELIDRVQFLTTVGKSKQERVREMIKARFGKITKREILDNCPDISQITVQRALNELLQSGEIIKIGGGRYTQYTWNRERE